MNKQILLISSNSSSRGGGERYLIYLTKGLRQLGHEVHVLLSKKSYMDYWAKLLTLEGAMTHRLPLVGLRHRPLRFLQSLIDNRQQQKIARFCYNLKPDAILVNQQYDEDGLDYLIGAMKARIAPVCGTIHMPMTAYKNRRPLGKIRGNLLQKWYQHHPYKMIFVSQGCQAEFHDYYQIYHQSNVVHLGCEFALNRVDTDINCSSVDRLPVIGFIGQFVAQKNLDLLIDSWLWLNRQGVKTKLLLVGDGNERSQLEAKLKASAPSEDWHVTGWQTNPQQYLSQIDVYAMSSHFEGLPLALVEAVGQGIPAVVKDFNGSFDVANRAFWVKVVSSDKAADFGQALQEVITDLSIYKEKAQKGKKQFCEYFSVKRMAQDTLVALQ